MDEVGGEATVEKISEILSKLEETRLSANLCELEETLNYKFKRRNLLEEALTHASVIFRYNERLESLGVKPPRYLQSKGIRSYERLEFVGDAVLGQVISAYLYSTYPDLDPGTLTRLRSETVRNENLARVAIKYGFFRHLLLECSYLEDMIQKFTDSIQNETKPFDGDSRVPKILADIVESIVGAVFVDSGHSSNKVWEVFGPLLHPLASPDTLEIHPVVGLQELCQKQGKSIEYKMSTNENEVTMEVYIDGQMMGRGKNSRKKQAKRAAAKNASDNLKQNIDLNRQTPC